MGEQRHASSFGVTVAQRVKGGQSPSVHTPCHGRATAMVQGDSFPVRLGHKRQSKRDTHRERCPPLTRARPAAATSCLFGVLILECSGRIDGKGVSKLLGSAGAEEECESRVCVYLSLLLARDGFI